MTRAPGERGQGRLGCSLWLLLAGLIIYAGYEILPPRLAAARFQDFMTEEAAFGSSKGNAQLMYELLNQAKEQDLPITKNDLEITRTRESITIAAHYEVTIRFFGQFPWVWKFDPVVVRPLVSL